MQSDSFRPPGFPPSRAKTKRARLLMPIAIAVAGLVVFLVLFWPAGHGKKGSKGYSGDGRGGSSTSRSSESPVGGGGPGNGPTPVRKAVGGTAISRRKKKEGGWWYQDEPEGSGSKKDPVKDSRSPVGGQ